MAPLARSQLHRLCKCSHTLRTSSVSARSSLFRFEFGSSCLTTQDTALLRFFGDRCSSDEFVACAVVANRSRQAQRATQACTLRTYLAAASVQVLTPAQTECVGQAATVKERQVTDSVRMHEQALGGESSRAAPGAYLSTPPRHAPQRAAPPAAQSRASSRAPPERASCGCTWPPRR